MCVCVCVCVLFSCLVCLMWTRYGFMFYLGGFALIFNHIQWTDVDRQNLKANYIQRQMCIYRSSTFSGRLVKVNNNIAERHYVK